MNRFWNNFIFLKDWYFKYHIWKKKSIWILVGSWEWITNRITYRRNESILKQFQFLETHCICFHTVFKMFSVHINVHCFQMTKQNESFLNQFLWFQLLRNHRECFNMIYWQYYFTESYQSSNISCLIINNAYHFN